MTALKATSVRRYDTGLRWHLKTAGNTPLEITADTTFDGALLDLQVDRYTETAGDRLGHEVQECLLDALATRKISASLDEIDRSRFGRVLSSGERRAG
ncbi:MAG TPA: hypothetical protein VIH71_07605 [Solirubrobacteraceae bacterium]